LRKCLEKPFTEIEQELWLLAEGVHNACSRLDGVFKIYRIGTLEKGIHAVSNVRLGYPNGDVISLIRESGSGKSTIAR